MIQMIQITGGRGRDIPSEQNFRVLSDAEILVIAETPRTVPCAADAVFASECCTRCAASELADYIREHMRG